MSQHFLLSPAAKTLSLVKVMRMSDEEARMMFRKIRWTETNGEPICPECGCVDHYDLKTRQVYKCKGCSLRYLRTDLDATKEMPNDDPSTKEAIVDTARSVLQQVYPGPLMIGDLFDAVVSRGINIGGQNPKGNLSAKLAPIDDIVYIKDEGWYYRPQMNEPSDRKLVGNRSESSVFKNQAKGREAAPGGGP